MKDLDLDGREVNAYKRDWAGRPREDKSVTAKGCIHIERTKHLKDIVKQLLDQYPSLYQGSDSGEPCFNVLTLLAEINQGAVYFHPKLSQFFGDVYGKTKEPGAFAGDIINPMNNKSASLTMEQIQNTYGYQVFSGSERLSVKIKRDEVVPLMETELKRLIAKLIESD